MIFLNQRTTYAMVDKVRTIRYYKRYMLHKVIGIKQFQSNLPSVARDIKEMGGHYLITNHNEPTMVAIPFTDYQSIEDILFEMNSPKLQKDIEAGRSEYHAGKTTSLDDFLSQNP